MLPSLPDPFAVTRKKLLPDGWIGTLNYSDETTGEKMNKLGGNKTTRIMDWAALFRAGP